MQDLNDKINNGGATADGQLSADEWNQLPSEVQNAIESAGMTLSGGDLSQLVKSIAHYSSVGQFFTGAGIADAYTATVVAPRIAPPALVNGMELNLIIPVTGTGAGTLNAFGTGIVDIKLEGGTSDPVAGDLEAGKLARFKYFTAPSAHWGLINPIISGAVGGAEIQIFTSSGTYIPSAGVKAIELTAVGGGGGGGGVDGQGAGNIVNSTAGGGSGWSRKLTSIIDSSYAIVIGAGGLGGLAGNNNGAVGGNTTIISTSVNMAANGGGGGIGMLGGAPDIRTDGATGGTASGGDTNSSGDDSVAALINNAKRASESASGASLFGGAIKTANGATGSNAITNGAGGGAISQVGSASNWAGGDGAEGIVIIKEFF